MKEVTIFTLWGNGDTMNITWAPRIIKERIDKNIFVRVVVKNSHKLFFETNPFVDDVLGISNEESDKFKRCLKLNKFENEVNLWCGADKTPQQCEGFRDWDIPYESAKIFNNFFKTEVIKYSDNLLPELYYTENEKKKALDFVKENKPFVVIELENFSSQLAIPVEKMVQYLYQNITNKNFKIYTSIVRNNLNIPFFNLKDYNLRQVGLINEGSVCFFGLSSGVTVASFERSLNVNKFIAAPTLVWVNCLNRHAKSKGQFIQSANYLSFVSNHINNLKA